MKILISKHHAHTSNARNARNTRNARRGINNKGVRRAYADTVYSFQ